MTLRVMFLSAPYLSKHLSGLVFSSGIPSNKKKCRHVVCIPDSRARAVRVCHMAAIKRRAFMPSSIPKRAKLKNKVKIHKAQHVTGMVKDDFTGRRNICRCTAPPTQAVNVGLAALKVNKLLVYCRKCRKWRAGRRRYQQCRRFSK